MQVAKALAHLVRLEDFVADIRRLHLQADVRLLDAPLGFLLYLVEVVDAVLRFVGAGLRHAAHPV